MKNFIVLLIFVLSCIHGQAQRSHQVYVELLGNGVQYSLNYDVRFTKGDHSLGGRIGLSKVGVQTIVPIQLNKVIGEGKHKVEAGLGVTANLYQEDYEGRRYPVLGNASLMYRFHPEKSDFVFRVGYAPTIILRKRPSHDWSQILNFWPGASVGYEFG